MDIYVLDSSFKKLDIIDYCESIIWTSRYCNAGDFELYLPITPKALSLLKVNRFLMRADKPDQLMIISSIQITTDEEAGDHITVSGKSSEGLIEKRIVWKQTNLSGKLIACVQRLLNENLISPTITSRKIPNIEMGNCCSYDIQLSMQITGANLLEAIISILSIYKLGFKFIFTGEKLQFCIYSGEYKSNVEFSNEFDNLLASEYSANITDYKNVALVAGEGEGAKRKTYAVGEASGIDRVEIFVDARDISSEVDEGTLDADKYNALLKAKGIESLNATIAKESFSGTVEPSVNYQFGIDYDLGDVVQVVNEYGISAPARITEIIEAWDDNGYSCIPTFNSEEV